MKKTMIGSVLLLVFMMVVLVGCGGGSESSVPSDDQNRRYGFSEGDSCDDISTIHCDELISEVMYVSDIYGEVETIGKKKWNAYVTVSVKGYDGIPVEGEWVLGKWSQDNITGGNTAGQTDENGEHTFFYPSPSGKIITFDLLSVNTIIRLGTDGYYGDYYEYIEELDLKDSVEVNKDRSSFRTGETYGVQLSSEMMYIDSSASNSVFVDGMWQAEIDFVVLDFVGDPIRGVAVTGVWDREWDSSFTVTADTNGAGKAMFKEKFSFDEEYVTFKVTSVEKNNYLYVSDYNETVDEDVIDQP